MKRRIFGVIMIIVGLSIIGGALYVRYSANRKQKAMIEAFEKSLEDVEKETGDGQDASKSPNNKPNTQNVQGAIGIMIIPKIDLTVAIGKDVQVDTLKYAVGHFEGTAMPGEKGNFCVAGHRSYTYNEYFNRLDELQVGDDIIVKTKKGEFRYKVDEKKVVVPEEVSVLDKTKDPTITLVTCTPIRVATHRLIIKGKLVK